MGKYDDAKNILQALGVPKSQQSPVCCFTLLALAGLQENDKWDSVSNNWVGTHGVKTFLINNYNKIYAENSRENIRKNAMHPFRIAGFVEDNGVATNSSNYSYRLTEEMKTLLSFYDSNLWEEKLAWFQSIHDSLKSRYETKRNFTKIPVTINGKQFSFSTGSHNKLQKAIIEEFAPRFAPQSECLYVGDTTKKDLVKNEQRLQELGFSITLHDKMPDIVLYMFDRDWLLFVEAVTSVGPMSPKRIIEIGEMINRVKSKIIYVTAFLDFKTFKKFSSDLAWETEVWIAEIPDHMIHYNGDKFLGPRK